PLLSPYTTLFRYRTHRYCRAATIEDTAKHRPAMGPLERVDMGRLASVALYARKPQLHSFVGRAKAYRRVKLYRFRTLLIRRQLHQTAAHLASPLYRMFDQRATDALTPNLGRNAHAFDLRTPASLVCHAWDEGQLEHTHNAAQLLGNDQHVVRIVLDRLEGHTV